MPSSETILDSGPHLHLVLMLAQDWYVSEFTNE